MRATANALRQHDAADRAGLYIGRIYDYALGPVFDQIRNKANEVTIVFAGGIKSGRKTGLTAVALLAEIE